MHLPRHSHTVSELHVSQQQRCLRKPCPSGHTSIGSGVTGRTCEECETNCGQCTSSDTCTQCSNSMYLNNNGDCVTTCPSGYTGIGSGETWRTCEACGTSCDQCSSSSTCTQCSEFHVPRQQRRLHVNMPKCSCQYRFRGNRTHLRGLKDGCG